MIAARYDTSDGAWVGGFLHLPSINRTLDVAFLIDTGSSISAISTRDLARFGVVPLRDVPLLPGPRRMTGLGGTVNHQLFLAGLAFEHVGGGLTQFRQHFALISTPGIPSLLGRDVLAMGSMHYEGIAGAVTLEFEQGLFRLG